MYKSKTKEAINFGETDLIICFKSPSLSVKLGMEMFIHLNKLENIGYLYSENLIPVVSNSADNKTLNYNGSIYYQKDKKICLLDITSGVQDSEIDNFKKELINFINESKFKNIYLFGASSKDNAEDIDSVGNEVNFYYLSNDESFKPNANIKPIKEAFKITEEKRKGRTYFEMSKVEGNDFLLKFVQQLILDKIIFKFIFTFENDLFDPFCGLAVFKKMAKIFGFSEDDTTVYKKEINLEEILALIEKEIKIDLSQWKLKIKME